jgi:hypothetical protein
VLLLRSISGPSERTAIIQLICCWANQKRAVIQKVRGTVYIQTLLIEPKSSKPEIAR